MKFKLGSTAAAVIAAVSLSLAGCGGGGHHGHHHDDPEEDSVYVDIQVIDGYLKDARVFIDLNRNFEWDPQEPRGYTDYEGIAHLDVRKEELDKHGDTPLQVIVTASKGTSDYVYGVKDTLNSQVTMSRNIFVNRDMHDGVWYVISPFSVLNDISIYGTREYYDYDSYQGKLADLAGTAGASEKVIFDNKDYNLNIRDENDLRTVVAGEVLTRRGLLPEPPEDLEKMIKAGSTDSAEIEKCRELTGEITDYALEDMKDNPKYSGNDLLDTIDEVLKKNARTEEGDTPKDNSDTPAGDKETAPETPSAGTQTGDETPDTPSV